MKLSKALLKEKTNVPIKATTTFNAPGTYIPPYGKTVVKIGGRGASGNYSSGGTYAGEAYVSTNPTTYPYASTNPTTYPYASTNPTTYPYAGTNPTTYPYAGTNPTTYPYASTNPTTYPYGGLNPETPGTVVGVSYYWTVPDQGDSYEEVTPGVNYGTFWNQYYYSGIQANTNFYTYYNPSTPGNAYYNTVPGTANYNTVPGNAYYNTVPGTAYYNTVPGTANYNTVPGTANYNTVPGTANYTPYYNPYYPGSSGSPSNIGGVYFPAGASDSLAPVVALTNTAVTYGASGLSVTVPPGGYITIQNI